MLDNTARVPARPVYLIVADETDEFETALQYAVQSAQRNDASLAVLQIIPDGESTFMPWGGISEKMEQAQIKRAEEALDFAKNTLKSKGIEPLVYMKKGHPEDVVRDVIKDNGNITRLVLAANTDEGDPGPLVSYFTGAGLKSLGIPLTIVPSHLSFQQ